MKNGLLIYTPNPVNNIFNIGDYIQSLAAKQFFNEIDIYLNRENLNTYNGDKVKVIMNGWFMHSPNNWPPSNDIIPFFISFHLNKLAQKELLSEESIYYLKKYQPIGCRDYNTVNLLIKHGVNAYFSGCLTLSLRLSYINNGNGNKIYFTDAYFNYEKNISTIITSIITLMLKPLTIYRITIKKEGFFSFKTFLKSAYFYSVYSQMFEKKVLINAEYIKHEIYDSFENEDAKFEYADKILKCYSKAKFIVTSRIHCALPCLSMNTPVLYIDNVNDSEVSSCRLDGLKEFFNIIKYNKGKLSYENFTSSRISINTLISNKKVSEGLIENLIKKCNDFAGI